MFGKKDSPRLFYSVELTVVSPDGTPFVFKGDVDVEGCDYRNYSNSPFDHVKNKIVTQLNVWRNEMYERDQLATLKDKYETKDSTS